MGPRIVAEESGVIGKRIWVVAGEPPPRPDPFAPRKPRRTDVVETDIDHAETVTERPVVESDTGNGQRSPQTKHTSTRSIPPGAVEIRVLGPVDVIGWQEQPNRRVVPELACFLALHPDRMMTSEEIRSALWPGDLETTEASPKHLRNAIYMLRKCLGRELVPEASKGRGYFLAGDVRSDWTQFNALVDEAKPSNSDEAELLGQALELIRGAPFEGAAPGTYAWAWSELFVSRMEVSITEAASRLAAISLERSLSVSLCKQGIHHFELPGNNPVDNYKEG